MVGCVIALVLVGGGSFYGGMKYQTSKTPTVASRAGVFANGAGGRMGGLPGRGMGGANGAGFLAGEVVSKDASSLTLKLSDGGSKIVLYTSSTRIGKTTEGTINDLTNGTTVTVNGTANQGGSVTADMIQIRPAGAATSTRR